MLHGPQLYYVICKPEESVCTKDMYAQIDARGIRPAAGTKKLMAGIHNHNLSQIARNLYNVFEPLAVERVPEIAKIKQQMKQYGALGAQMTGSGSAVFGIFENFEKAAEACEILHEKYQYTFLTTNGDPEQAD